MDVTAVVAVLVVATAAALRLAVQGRDRLAITRRLEPADRLPPVVAPTVLSGLWRTGLVRRSDGDVAALARSAARSLRGGDSPGSAFAMAASAHPGSGSVAERAAARIGDVGLRAAVDEWCASDPRPSVRLVAAALAAGAAAGGSMARALDGAADTIEARMAIQRETRAQAATARASATVLVLAPAAFATIATVGDDSALAFLLTTPAGLICLTIAVSLDVLGAIWMAKVTAAPS